MKAVGIYARISFDPFAQSAGVERQLADCRRIAAERWPGGDVVEYVDRDTSAWSGKRRAAFEAMLDDLEGRRLSAFVVWDADRLARQPRDLERVLDAIDGKRIGFATAQGSIDLGTSDGRLVARLLVSVASKASDDTSRRVKRSIADRRAKGHRISGRPAYGVRSHIGAEITAEPEQAARIATAARRLLDGESLYAVANYLREDPAAPQSTPGIRNLLMTSKVLDPVVRADVAALLSSPERRPRATNARQHWLSGLLLCSVCASAMRWQRGTYVCRGGSCVGINAEKVEAEILRLAFAVSGLQRRAAEPVPVAPAADVQERLDELAAMFAAGEITASEWRSARAATAPVVEQPTPLPPVVDDLGEAWEGLDVNEQHRAVAALWSAVYVKPMAKGARPRFDPDRLLYVPQKRTRWGSMVITDPKALSAAELAGYIGMHVAELHATAITITADGTSDPRQR